MLGWNIPYEFNDSDFEVSEHLLTNYLDQYEETAWEALRYLIADINYGGHVTDDWDRRLLGTYIGEYFKDDVLKEPFYKLSILPHYYVPRDGTLNAYREFVSMLPQIDHPEAFGQHPNADITSQIQETRMLLDTLLSLQPQVNNIRMNYLRWKKPFEYRHWDFILVTENNGYNKGLWWYTVQIAWNNTKEDNVFLTFD